MSNNKYKITGFARFFIFMIFFVPVAYIGASYYNGEDGIGKIKKLLNIESKSSTTVIEKEYDCDLLLKEKETEIKRLKATIIRMNEAEQ